MFFILAMSFAFLSSCWDARELSEIGIVVVTGFDLDDDGLERVTVLSVQPFGRAATQGTTPTTWFGTASGKSAFEAMRNLRQTATRTLVWMHNKIILIGEEKAKKGIGNISDLLGRNREFRYDTTVFVTKGRAEELMQIPSNLEQSLFQELLGLIENTKLWSGAFALEMKDFEHNAFSMEHGGYVIGNMSSYETLKLPFSINRQEHLKLYNKDELYSVAYIGGGAVIDRNKLAGWLSDDEIQGYLLIGNKLKRSIVYYEDQNGLEYNVTLDILQSNTKISFPDASVNNLKAKISTKISAAIAEIDGAIEDLDPVFIKELEKKIKQKFISNMALTMDLAQNRFHTDFVEFHKELSAYHPAIWKQVKNDWRDIFPEIDVKYDVDLKIKQLGLLTRTISKLRK
ncbi:MAG: Ger(x)C family spore germination protein [Bacillota bacterium]|nr:Ger(x)C family spore germination protein [Bacillota bacterium]